MGEQPARNLTQQTSLDERPHWNLELLALHVVEFCLYWLPYSQLVLDRRHLDSPLDHSVPIDVRKPRMLFDRFRVVFEAQSFLGVLGQQLLDQVSEHFRSVFGETNDSLSHEVIQFSLGLGVKWGKTCIQLIHNNSKLVPIGHSSVSFLVNDFQRQIGRRSTEGFVEVVQIFSSFGKAKIGDESVPIFVKDDVFGFQISVKDIIFVQSLQAQQYFRSIVSDVFLLEFFPLFQKFGKISSFAEIHHKEKISFSLESKSEFDDEGMIDQAQNIFLGLNITVETGPKNSLLSDGLQSKQFIEIGLLDKVDLSKGSLTNFLVEFEARQGDGFDPMGFFYELIHFEYIFPPHLGSVHHALLLSALLHFILFLFGFLLLRFMLQHSLHHISMVGSASIERIFLLNMHGIPRLLED